MGTTMPEEKAPESAPSSRVAGAAGALLEKRSSRRGFLGRLGLVAAALSVAPLRYLLRPESAWAVIGPGGCGGGLCTDGYTEFCCAINDGQNSCPPHTFVGGWWKCTYYAGRRLCGEENVRYYVDCNLKPGHGFPGGCHCARGDCGNRRVACNVFRYGQCNAEIGEVTPIACRVVVCENPATIPEFRCNATYKVDDSTCGQEAGCLSEKNVTIVGRNPGA
jgi:hypothetical protein